MGTGSWRCSRLRTLGSRYLGFVYSALARQVDSAQLGRLTGILCFPDIFAAFSERPPIIILDLPGAREHALTQLPTPHPIRSGSVAN